MLGQGTKIAPLKNLSRAAPRACGKLKAGAATPAFVLSSAVLEPESRAVVNRTDSKWDSLAPLPQHPRRRPRLGLRKALLAHLHQARSDTADHHPL